MQRKNEQLSTLQLETFLNILFADDSDYIFAAQILAAMCPMGW